MHVRERERERERKREREGRKYEFIYFGVNQWMRRPSRIKCAAIPLESQAELKADKVFH